MPKMDLLDPQEAEEINKQNWKQFWWTPCIVAYFKNQRSKTKKFTKPVEIFWINISKCYIRYANFRFYWEEGGGYTNKILDLF